MKRRSIHIDSDQAGQELYEQILSEFKQLYEAADQPKRMTLYQVTDSEGLLQAVYFTPESIVYCDSLFKPPVTWVESDKPDEIGEYSWVAGDEEPRVR
jgi:hypothetical protein